MYLKPITQLNVFIIYIVDLKARELISEATGVYMRSPSPYGGIPPPRPPPPVRDFVYVLTNYNKLTNYSTLFFIKV